MQDLIASLEKLTFDFERFVEDQMGSLLLPFPGMDKSGVAVCNFFNKGLCRKGTLCPFRHLTGEKTVVCKHWLRGLCKKGDLCEFLHEYDMARMPECYFYSKFGDCSNKDCPFLHIDPASKIKDCPWYDRGFCKHGPACKYRHIRRAMCPNYLVGFCPEGPKCKYAHPRADWIFASPDQPKESATQGDGAARMEADSPQRRPAPSLLPCDPEPVIKQPPLADLPHLTVLSSMQESLRRIQLSHCVGLRPLDQVTCFKCGEKGHYANKCPRSASGQLIRK